MANLGLGNMESSAVIEDEKNTKDLEKAAKIMKQMDKESNPNNNNGFMQKFKTKQKKKKMNITERA